MTWNFPSIFPRNFVHPYPQTIYQRHGHIQATYRNFLLPHRYLHPAPSHIYLPIRCAHLFLGYLYPPLVRVCPPATHIHLPTRLFRLCQAGICPHPEHVPLPLKIIIPVLRAQMMLVCSRADMLCMSFFDIAPTEYLFN